MIYLREVKIEDANRLFEICSKEDVTTYLSWYPHENIEETKFVINNLYLKKHLDDLPNNYVICLNETDLVIGVIDFFKNNNHVEIGYFLDPNYWGQGIMTEALKKLLDIGFNKYNFNEVYISHISENAGSEKVILKNYFKFLNEEMKHYQKFSKMVKTYILTRSDYNAKQS